MPNLNLNKLYHFKYYFIPARHLISHWLLESENRTQQSLIECFSNICFKCGTLFKFKFGIRILYSDNIMLLCLAGMLCRICTCALYPLPKMGICAFALSELGKCGIASRALASTRFCNHAQNPPDFCPLFLLTQMVQRTKEHQSLTLLYYCCCWS